MENIRLNFKEKKIFIHGEWVESKTNNLLSVISPLTGKVICQVPNCSLFDVERALHSAKVAFDLWKKYATSDRAALQHAAATEMRKQKNKLAYALMLEVGRPFNGCVDEIENSADLLDYLAEEGIRITGNIPYLNLPTERVLVVKEPIGVVVAITPCNYPVALLVSKLGAALVCGCTVVAKPSENTPITTLLLAEIFHKAKFPPGVFNVITGKGDEAGDELVKHSIPRKIAFTGSRTVGKRISSIASNTNKRVLLEMGGQSPAVVLRDANLDVATTQLVKYSFRNSGQLCYRSNRIYVEKDIFDDFVTSFISKTRQIRVGNNIHTDCDMGPLINKATHLKVKDHIDDAVQKGAEVAFGGYQLVGGEFDNGYYWTPTVLKNTNSLMKIMTEETFGPAVGIMSVGSVGDIIKLCNETVFGLAAFVFTENISKGLILAENLECGMVWVNDIHRTYNEVPFGGVKESGVGREKSSYGLDEYLETKTIYLSLQPWKPE